MYYGYILHKVYTTFPKSLHYQHNFSIFARDAVCVPVKLFADNAGSHHARSFGSSSAK